MERFKGIPCAFGVGILTLGIALFVSWIRLEAAPLPVQHPGDAKCCVTLTGPSAVIEWSENVFYADLLMAGDTLRIYNWYVDNQLVRSARKTEVMSMHADTLSHFFGTVGADNIEVRIEVFISDDTFFGSDSDIFPVIP